MAQHTIIVNVQAKPDQIDFVKEKLVGLLAPTRVEKGCVTFTLHQNSNDPCHFVFLEIWESRDLWQAHMNTEAFAVYKESIAGAISEIGFHEMSQLN